MGIESLDKILGENWRGEAALYYEGFVYWLEGYDDPKTGASVFFIDRWKAKCEDGKVYHSYQSATRELEDYACVYKDEAKEVKTLKERFQEAKVFAGKTFAEVEKQIAWVQEGDPITSGA